MAALTKEAELSKGGLGLFKALTGTKQKCWTLFCLSQEHALFGIKRLWGCWKTSEHEITLLEMVWGFCSWGWGLVRDGLSGKPSQTAEGHRGQGAGRVPASRRQTCLLRPTKKPQGPWSDARRLGEVRPNALSDVSNRHQNTKTEWCLDPKQEQQRNRQVGQRLWVCDPHSLLWDL